MEGNLFPQFSADELRALGPMLSVGIRHDIDVPRTLFITIRHGDIELEYDMTEEKAKQIIRMIGDAIDKKGLYAPL